MELWIRSQDKNILEKVNKLYVATCEEENGFGIYDIIYDDLDDCDVPLGFYKTKERALEVLYEIQYKIKNMYILENCKLPKDSCIEQRLAMDDFNIYEMPEK